MATRAEFQQYVSRTLARLEQQPPDRALLQQKIVPQVVESIDRLAANAPADVKERIAALLVSAGLKSDTGGLDVAALRTALHDIAQIASSPGNACTSDSGSKLEALACDAARGGGNAPVDARTSTPSSPGKEQLQQYLMQTRSRLRNPIDAGHLKDHVMPSIVSSIGRLLQGAPAELNDSVQEVLRRRAVLPGFGASQEGLADALWDIHGIVGFESPPLEVVVVNLAGDEVMRSELDSSAAVSRIRLTVSEKMQRPAGCIELVAGTDVMKDGHILSDHIQEGGTLNICASIVQQPDVSGAFAAYTCTMLVLWPNGDMFECWYDDYWESPLKTSCTQRSPAEWASETTPSGTWSFDTSTGQRGRIVGRFRDSMTGDESNFDAEVVESSEGLVEGISTLTLQANFYWSFATPGKGPEKKTLYLVARMPMQDLQV